MQYRKDKYGNELSVLGYGCMRFTQTAGRIDLKKAEEQRGGSGGDTGAEWDTGPGIYRYQAAPLSDTEQSQSGQVF